MAKEIHRESKYEQPFSAETKKRGMRCPGKFSWCLDGLLDFWTWRNLFTLSLSWEQSRRLFPRRFPRKVKISAVWVRCWWSHWLQTGAWPWLVVQSIQMSLLEFPLDLSRFGAWLGTNVTTGTVVPLLPKEFGDQQIKCLHSMTAPCRPRDGHG